ncbi:MAG: hypothetical protein GY820_00750 [Gammaproteobacteria bacterium]|nr:hypothetical protein [Gammaproteobacteria bacterium]
MKVKKITAVLIGALSMTVFSTTAAYAVASLLLCESGDVVRVGVGDVFVYQGLDVPQVFSPKPVVTLKCDKDKSYLLTGDIPDGWTDDMTSEITYTVVGSKKGILATALTAKAKDKKVLYIVQPKLLKKKQADSISGNLKGIQVL